MIVNFLCAGFRIFQGVIICNTNRHIILDSSVNLYPSMCYEEEMPGDAVPCALIGSTARGLKRTELVSPLRTSLQGVGFLGVRTLVLRWGAVLNPSI